MQTSATHIIETQIKEVENICFQLVYYIGECIYLRKNYVNTYKFDYLTLERDKSMNKEMYSMIIL